MSNPRCTYRLSAIGLLLGLAFSFVARAQEVDTSRPNILLCIADDWGWPHAGAYGDLTIATPNFDRLAREGMLFTHAFATAPSCTAVRNSIITGKHPWALGPGANLFSTLPSEHESFVHLLRDSGYITGRSNHKQWGPGRIASWVEDHGDHPATTQLNNIGLFLDHYEAERSADDEPFFYWLAAHDPHRGYRRGQHAGSNIDPDLVQRFEHFPDSSVIREDIADYYFAVQRWDSLVGQAIAELEERGMLDNTIIIVTGDHGMPFPRCKANLYDSGTRVPLAIHWGDRIQPGQAEHAFVALGDLAPTLLELGGVEVPSNMTMHSFAGLLTPAQGDDPPPRSEIILGRERHTPAQGNDSTVGYPSRALRTSQWLYIRNFEPDRWPAGSMEPGADGQPAPWLADCDAGPSRNYIFDNRDLDEAHRRAFELSFGRRPAEELYDIEQDPGQLNNLADDPAYAQALQPMRDRIQQLMIETNDPRATDPHTTEFDEHPYFGGVFRR